MFKLRFSDSVELSCPPWKYCQYCQQSTRAEEGCWMPKTPLRLLERDHYAQRITNRPLRSGSAHETLMDRHNLLLLKVHLTLKLILKVSFVQLLYQPSLWLAVWELEWSGLSCQLWQVFFQWHSLGATWTCKRDRKTTNVTVVIHA